MKYHIFELWVKDIIMKDHHSYNVCTQLINKQLRKESMKKIQA